MVFFGRLFFSTLLQMRIFFVFPFLLLLFSSWKYSFILVYWFVGLTTDFCFGLIVHLFRKFNFHIFVHFNLSIQIRRLSIWIHWELGSFDLDQLLWVFHLFSRFYFSICCRLFVCCWLINFGNLILIFVYFSPLVHCFFTCLILFS